MSLSFIYQLRFVLKNLFDVADVHIAAIKRAREKLRRRNEAGIQRQWSGERGGNRSAVLKSMHDFC